FMIKSTIAVVSGAYFDDHFIFTTPHPVRDIDRRPTKNSTMPARQLAIYPHFGKVIDPIKTKQYMFSRRNLPEVKLSFVVPYLLLQLFVLQRMTMFIRIS